MEQSKTKEDILVSVLCITYNQISYIRQCIDSLLMQKTNFKYEIIIHDDCSTDGTSGLVKEYSQKYPDLIVPIIQSVNQYQNGIKSIIASFMLPKVRGKYIAVCEGDDYWTDSLKLQKQVDVLENNPNVYMVYTAFNTVDENSEIIIRPRYSSFIKRSHSGNILPDLFYSNFILTFTTMIRREVFFSEIYMNSAIKYDYTLFFASAFMGESYFLQDVTGSYRKTGGSAITSHHKEVERELYKNYCYFVDLYLDSVHTVQCKMRERIRIYRNMMVNMFFHNDNKHIKLIIKKNIFTSLLVPEAFSFSLLKKLKWKTYGSIDR